MTADLPDRSLRDVVDSLALVVVDVQRGFTDLEYWGPRDNPDCEQNIARLIETWRRGAGRIVFVRHDSVEPASPLRPGQRGNAFQEVVTGTPDLLVVKSVHSAFHGSPDLDAWLRHEQLSGFVVCGITTNHCCETTARVGADLGNRVVFALDATHTFDRRNPAGVVVPAADLAAITATNLADEFAEIATTDELTRTAKATIPTSEGFLEGL